jgi:2-iminobutanoate/2-iminopropanoate deaminase
MAENLLEHVQKILATEQLSAGESNELVALERLLSSETARTESPEASMSASALRSIEKHAVTAHSVLNEAYEYGAAFSRGLRLEFEHFSLLFISGTASVNEEGDTVHPGDFGAQCWRTYRNITTLLESEGASWKDVVKTTCYLRDIERDYHEFNRIRTEFFRWQDLDPLPASVGIQARLCRGDLLIEIEAIAVRKKTDASARAGLAEE